MFVRSTTLTVAATLALTALAFASTMALTDSAQERPLLTDDQLRQRTSTLIANQHKDDLALEQYERIEHHVDRTSGSDGRILEDKTYRVVPTGPGTLKILLKDGDKPADPAEILQQLKEWRDLLQLALNPNDARIKAAYAKAEKKKHDRAELVDAAGEAFVKKVIGRETLNGRDCDVIELDSNPHFQPRSTFQEALTHATVKLWVDHNAIQVVRGEAHIIRDVSFGGGILGKLYRGGVFFLEQTEVAPGVWLPARYQYDYTARKFLFTFEQHEYIEASHYRFLGPPRDALIIAKSDLAKAESGHGDP